MSSLTVWLTAFEILVLEECLRQCTHPKWGPKKRAAYTRMVAKVVSAIRRARGTR